MNLPSKIISTAVMALAIGMSVACSSLGSAPAADDHAPTPSDYDRAEIARKHGYVVGHYLVEPVQVNAGWEDCTTENGIPGVMLTTNTVPPDTEYYARGEPGDAFSVVVVMRDGEYQCLLGILSYQRLPDSTAAPK